MERLSRPMRRVTTARMSVPGAARIPFLIILKQAVF
jgi:hypothetical protein